MDVCVYKCLFVHYFWYMHIVTNMHKIGPIVADHQASFHVILTVQSNRRKKKKSWQRLEDPIRLVHVEMKIFSGASKWRLSCYIPLVELDDVYQKWYVLLAGDVVVSCWKSIMYLDHLERIGGATPMYWFRFGRLLSHLLGVAPPSFTTVYVIDHYMFMAVISSRCPTEQEPLAQWRKSTSCKLSIVFCPILGVSEVRCCHLQKSKSSPS